MNTKKTVQAMENKYTTTTTADKSLDMMSLFDYLGHAAGEELGKKVAGIAAKRSVRTAIRQVITKKYTGPVMLYPKSFLDWYFKPESNETELFKHDNKLPF